MSEEWNVLRIMELCFGGLKEDDGNGSENNITLKFRMRIFEKLVCYLKMYT